MCNWKKKGGSLMLENNNVQAGLINTNAKIDAKAEINTDIKGELKAADTIHTQIGGTTTYNNDSSKQVIQQNFAITILPGMNVDKSIKQALVLGNENAKLVGADIQKLLKDNNISPEQVIEKLSNPEMIHTIAKANEIAYKTSDIDKRKTLSDLIYKKITTDIDSEESNLLSLAIQEMDILTINHIKALSFLYIIKSNYLKNYSENELITFYEQILSVLFEFKNSNAKIVGRFLASTRTLSAAHIGWNITSYLPQILTKNSTSHKETVRNEFIIWNTMWNDLGFMGAYITPIGEYIAKTYLFNNFGLLIENFEEKNSTKDLSDDVSAAELKETLEDANKNLLTWEEI